MSSVLPGKVASDQVLRLECVSYTTASQSNASPRAAEHSTCNRRSQDPLAHTIRAASDHIGPSSWQQRCCLRSSVQSRPLRSSRGFLLHAWHRETHQWDYRWHEALLYDMQLSVWLEVRLKMKKTALRRIVTVCYLSIRNTLIRLFTYQNRRPRTYVGRPDNNSCFCNSQPR